MSLLKHKVPASLLCSLLLTSLVSFFSINTSLLTILEIDVIMISSVPFSLSFIFDWVSLSFSAIVSLVALCVFIFSCKYMESDNMINRFTFLLTSFVISMNLLIFSGSLLQLLIGWDGLGVTSFILIIYYQSSSSLSAGFQTLMTNRIGDVLILLSAGSFIVSGSFSLMFVLGSSATLLTLAALTKSAQYPFSSWLPAAMAAPTPVSALVHSSTLVTAGVYLVIRVSMSTQMSESISATLLMLGSITCLLGSFAAFQENDLKKIVALSTLSQLGVMVFGLGLSIHFLALFHLYTHALFKALLFLAVGVIIMCGHGNQDLRLLGSLTLPYYVKFCLLLSSLCLLGAPFLSSFFSKHVILEATLLNSHVSLISFLIMLMGTVFTAAYSFRLLKSVCWTQQVISGTLKVGDTILCFFPMIILAFGAVTFGSFFSSLSDFLIIPLTIPSTWSNIIMLLPILGILSALTINPTKGRWLQSLFFLTPSLGNSGKLITKFLLSLSHFESGWLEPNKFFNYPILNSPQGLASLLLWPYNRHSIIRAGTMGVMSFIWIVQFFF
uniref:NADH-ubiquinone oxidoreductase chain 5 n=1 Tax=Imerinia grandidieri TaxID=3244470 RepID=G8HQX3_9EUPU|nr:NADH dehydrogenase subunit 5 [Rhopalocaulis grandidieri]